MSPHRVPSAHHEFRTAPAANNAPPPYYQVVNNPPLTARSQSLPMYHARNPSHSPGTPLNAPLRPQPHTHGLSGGQSGHATRATRTRTHPHPYSGQHAQVPNTHHTPRAPPPVQRPSSPYPPTYHGQIPRGPPNAHHSSHTQQPHISGHAPKYTTRPSHVHHNTSQAQAGHHAQSRPSVNTWNDPNHHSYFQYSKCTGRKKALCIGINYRGQSRELHGCVNDAINVQQFLCRQFGFKNRDIVVLVDDARDPRNLPTRRNILEAMRWLVRGAQPHDSLFFHYSGHGGQTKDLDGDEDDGYDEVIFPLDWKKHGHIVDDVMNEIMVKPLPTGCRLTAIFDSCHSGTALDLPYIYTHRGRARTENKYTRTHRGSTADVISLSGCKDSQTSADTYQAGKATGAMSYAFMTSLNMNPRQTYQELLLSTRAILKKRYSQKPQLSSTHVVDGNLHFIM